MTTCSECNRPVGGRVTCSNACRMRRHRRLRRERTAKLTQTGGDLWLLSEPTRLKIAEVIKGDVAFPPEGFHADRWRALCRGAVEVLAVSELRLLASWYPTAVRVMHLPSGATLDTGGDFHDLPVYYQGSRIA